MWPCYRTVWGPVALTAGSVPRACKMAHNCLLLQFQGLWHHFWPPRAPDKHMVHEHIRCQNTQTHTDKINMKLLLRCSCKTVQPLCKTIWQFLNGLCDLGILPLSKYPKAKSQIPYPGSQQKEKQPRRPSGVHPEHMNGMRRHAGRTEVWHKLPHGWTLKMRCKVKYGTHKKARSADPACMS